MAAVVNHQHPLRQPQNPPSSEFTHYMSMFASAQASGDKATEDYAYNACHRVGAQRDLFRLYWGIPDPRGRDLQAVYPNALRAPPGTQLPYVEPCRGISDAGIQVPTHAPLHLPQPTSASNRQRDGQQPIIPPATTSAQPPASGSSGTVVVHTRETGSSTIARLGDAASSESQSRQY